MKTSAKIYFMLGVLSTIGALAVTYYAKKNNVKTPKELFEKSKELFNDTVNTLDEEIDSAIEEVKDAA